MVLKSLKYQARRIPDLYGNIERFDIDFEMKSLLIQHKYGKKKSNLQNCGFMEKRVS